MKRKISLIMVCVVLAGLGLVPLAGQTASTQAVRDTVVGSQSKDAEPAQSSPTAASTDNAKASQESNAAQFSTGLDDVVKLVKAGLDESVVLTFIQTSAIAYDPSAQDIIKLRELGIASPIITALLRRGGEVRQHAAQSHRESPPRSAPPPAPAPALSAPPATAPASAVQPATLYSVPNAYPISYPSAVYATYPTCDYAPVGYYGYGGYGYPRYSSYYPRVNFYGGFHPRVSVGLRFGGVHLGGFHGGFRGGFRHCR